MPIGQNFAVTGGNRCGGVVQLRVGKVGNGSKALGYETAAQVCKQRRTLDRLVGSAPYWSANLPMTTALFYTNYSGVFKFAIKNIA